MVNAPQKWHLEVPHMESGMDKNTSEAINLQGEVVALEPQDATFGFHDFHVTFSVDDFAVAAT